MRPHAIHALASCLLSFLTLSCEQSTPFTGSESSTATATPTYSAEGRQQITMSLAEVRALTAEHEQFNCSHLRERHVRFSNPGGVDSNAVDLFYAFDGVPGEQTFLSIIWDEENAPDDIQILDLEGTGRTSGSLTDYSGTVPHVYDVLVPTTKVVRTALVVKGKTGDCSTVRRVEVTPPADDVVATPPPSCGLASGGGWQALAGTICHCPATSQTLNFLPDFANLCFANSFTSATWDSTSGECWCS